MKPLTNETKAVITYVLILAIGISIYSCDHNKPKPNNHDFQKNYDSANMAKVKSGIKNKIFSHYKKIRDTTYFAFNFIDIVPVDSEYANNRITGNKSFSKTMKSDLKKLGEENLIKDSLYMSALISHADSFVQFYTRFHGYKLYYHFFLESDSNFFRQVIWADTNANIVMMSYPWELKRIPSIDKNGNKKYEFVDSQEVVLIKKWWPDTLNPMFKFKKIDQ